VSNPVDMKFEFDISRFEQGLARLSKAVAGQALAKTATAGATVFEAHAKINVEENFTDQPTGFLKGSIRVGNVTASETRAEAEWGSYGVVYNRIHEFGGIIRATNGPYLTFQTSDGAWHTVPMVDIPARPYIRPAKDQNQPEAQGAMMVILEGEIRAAVPGALR
jgi:phage gpG-like protein